ncbi:MAG: hypothetical protein IH820_05895 [Bacteroidetes bacterium]|nr:hypothetical protein [Bacteroidota bacterium]
MARKKQTRGHCAYCGREMTRGGLARHVATCAERQARIAQAGKKRGREETLYHLQVQDAWGGDYWLHLEMAGSTTLEDLDYYLRAIWLECCGHLSRFSIGGRRGREIPMSTTLSRFFEPGLELLHIYDYGTTSETLVKVVAEREGKATMPHAVALMARNDAPEVSCVECERPAKWLCMECLYEYEEPGALCDEHAESHPHDDYGEPMPLVNSPRVGMCGYDGPAEPPY